MSVFIMASRPFRSSSAICGAAMVSLVGSLRSELEPRSIHVSMIVPDDGDHALTANEVADGSTHVLALFFICA